MAAQNSTFDESGNLAGAANGNGTKSFYYYDDAGHLKNLKLFKGNSGNLGDYGYTYESVAKLR